MNANQRGTGLPGATLHERMPADGTEHLLGDTSVGPFTARDRRAISTRSRVRQQRPEALALGIAGVTDEADVHVVAVLGVVADDSPRVAAAARILEPALQLFFGRA